MFHPVSTNLSVAKDGSWTFFLLPCYVQGIENQTVSISYIPVTAPNLDRIVFGVFFVLNLVLWSKGSSGAISFGILVALLALWFGISVPLTFVGAFFGFRKRVSFKKKHINYNSLFIFISIKICVVSLIADRTPCSDESDSPTGSRSKCLHTSGSGHRHGWRFAIWLHLYPAVLYSQLIVVQPNVLHVWISFLSLHHLGDHVFWNDSSTLLLPSVCWGLS